MVTVWIDTKIGMFERHDQSRVDREKPLLKVGTLILPGKTDYIT